MVTLKNVTKGVFMGRIKTNKLLVYDCEATCWNDREKTRNEGELIEIGIVPIDLSTFEVREDLSYSALIKPANTRISQYCTELTGISQDQIDERAKTFDVVVDEILNKYQQRVANGSWGNFDPKIVKKAAKAYDTRFPFEDTHYNLKNMYSLLSGRSRELSLIKAIEAEGLSFKGTQHTAIDDAINTAIIISKHLKFLRTSRLIAKNV